MNAVGQDHDALAERFARVIAGLRTQELRAAWLRDALRSLPLVAAADALELLCVRADEGESRAIAAVHALVTLLADPSMNEPRDALRGQARARHHLTLERLLRRPFVRRPDASPPSARVELDDSGVALVEQEEVRERGVPDYGRGRPLTLGERKSMARNPPPEMLQKILGDPHPDVIRMLLASPRLTEDDVVRLCTRRPNRAEVLHEVARHPRWCQRPRVRAALVLNPTTPCELSITMVALLRRNELRLVIETNALHPTVRAAARERLERRPPMRKRTDGPLQ